MGDHTFTSYGSWTQALMVSTMLLSYLENENVTKVLPHELVGTGVFGAMFNGNTDNLAYKNTDGVQYDPVFKGCDGIAGSTYKTQEWGKSASGTAVALISQTIEESTYAEEINFDGLGLNTIGGTTNRPVLYGWKFVKPYSIEYIIINMGGENYAIDAQNIIAAGNGNGYWEYLRAANTDYITGDPGSGTDHLPSYVGRIAFNPTSTFPVTGYSITRVVMPNTTACAMMLVPTEDHICEGSSTTISLKGIFPDNSSLIAWTIPSDLNGLFWNGSALISPGTGSAGTYTVSVTDGSCTATVSITVNAPPSLSVTNSNPLTVCAGSLSPVVLTASCSGGSGSTYQYIWTPTYGLTSTLSDPVIPFNNIVQAAPERTTDYIVYATDGTCWVSNAATPIHITSEKPVLTVSSDFIKCNDSYPVTLSANIDLNDGFSWSPGGGTVTNTAYASTYTVTVTNTTVFTVTTTGSCHVSATIKVTAFQNCCPQAGIGSYDVYVYDGNDPLFISRRFDLTTAIGNIVTKYYKWDGTNHNVYQNTTVNPKPIIFINGYFEVDNDISFTDCKIQFGEQAEVHVLKGQTLRFTGCDVQSCKGYTWRSIYADEGATVIVEDKSGTATSIADADTALNLTNGANYNVIKSTFSNNYVGMYLYEYRRAISPGNGMGNIHGNAFHSSSLKTSPLGSYGYGLSGISLNHTQSIQIGELPANNGAANTFENLYLGIQSLNANMEVFNNDFRNIQSLWGTTSGYAIYATSDFDYNDRTMKIGNHYSSGLNDFRSSETGVYAYGEQNIKIDKNKFGNVTQVTDQLTQSCIYIANNTKDIDVLYNDFYDFNIGTYLYDIKKSDSTININNNTYTNADLTLGGTDYGTAITLQNYTPTENNLNIFDNTIDNPRVGIHLKKVINGKIYRKDATLHPNGNYISYDIAAATTLTDNFSAILLDQSDYTFVHENTIDNTHPLTSTPAYLKGMNVSASTHGNYCSNIIYQMGYSMYFDDDCQNTKLKLNNMTGYNKAIYFNNAEFSDQASNTETWDNTFDNSTSWLSVPRLAGSLASALFIDWWFNSNDPTMDISGGFNTVLNNQITSQACSTCSSTACDALLALRYMQTKESENQTNDFIIYPNPANSTLSIELILIDNSTFDLSIIDILGRTITEVKGSNPILNINTNKFASGIYVVRIKIGKEVISKRLLIEH